MGISVPARIEKWSTPAPDSVSPMVRVALDVPGVRSSLLMSGLLIE